jgi:hypothetical protein
MIDDELKHKLNSERWQRKDEENSKAIYNWLVGDLY